MLRVLITLLFAASLYLPAAAPTVAVAADQDPPPWTDAAAQAYTPHQREAIGRRHIDQSEDYAAALPWYRSAAKAGSPTARAYMGWFHEQGRGVPRNGERATHWYALAVAAGAHSYSLHLAWMYLRGDLVAQDRSQADAWFQHGIARGLSEAKLAYGSVLYADMLGGDQDPATGSRAESLLLRALEDGQVYATRFLARMYFDGTGVDPDPDLGVGAVRLGAEAGDPEMQALLARILVEGRLAQTDLLEANTWASLAAAQGDASAAGLRLQLERQLSQEDIRESRQRALAWAGASYSERGAAQADE